MKKLIQATKAKKRKTRSIHSSPACGQNFICFQILLMRGPLGIRDCWRNNMFLCPFQAIGVIPLSTQCKERKTKSSYLVKKVIETTIPQALITKLKSKKERKLIGHENYTSQWINENNSDLPADGVSPSQMWNEFQIPSLEVCLLPLNNTSHQQHSKLEISTKQGWKAQTYPTHAKSALEGRVTWQKTLCYESMTDPYQRASPILATKSNNQAEKTRPLQKKKQHNLVINIRGKGQGSLNLNQ